MSTEIPTDILAFVAEVEARANKATPGPWSNCGASDGRCQCGLVWSNELDAGVLSTIAEDEQTNSSFSHDQRCDNAIFAANARTDVPTLIAIVRAQQRNHAFTMREWEHDATRANAAETELEVLRSRLAKLESLGPWIEANRLAQLQWAEDADARGDVNRREQRATFEARADAFKQVGYELNNRAGKDLRTTNPKEEKQ